MMNEYYIPSLGKPKIDHESAKRMWEMGRTDEEIAKAFHVTKDTAAKWRSSHGLKPNKHKKRKLPRWMENIVNAEAEARAHGTSYGLWTAPPVVVGRRR